MMISLTRFSLLILGLAYAGNVLASSNPSLVRNGVGLTGHPQRLSGVLDVNQNGRPELLVADRWHITIVEESANPRGYLEVVRVNAPGSSSYRSAMLVDADGLNPTLLLKWSDRLELRDATSLVVKAVHFGSFGMLALGDIDGDGRPEIVIAGPWSVAFHDPETLEPLGSVPLAAGQIAVADIVGDARAEIVSGSGRAFTVTRTGDTFSSSMVWDADIDGEWTPFAIDTDGHTAILLHSLSGGSAELATFGPNPSIRTLIQSDAPFSVVFADANADGRIDLVAAGNIEVVAVDIASGATLWTRDTIHGIPRLGFVHSPVAVDLDGDGTLEFAWADASYNSGVAVISMPLAGAPRWRTDFRQAGIVDWTLLDRIGNERSDIAYLTYGTQQPPRLGTIGLIDGATLADRSGSALAWLPGYSGGGMEQHAVTSIRVDGGVNTVVAGAEYPQFGGNALAHWLWTFDSNGAFLDSRTISSSTAPHRIVTAQVLDRPERQLVIAGWMPRGESGPIVQTARVEIVDYSTGNILWQSALLPTYDGAPLSKLEVSDLDADGKLEIVVAYGTDVVVLRPFLGSDVFARYGSGGFSILDRGAGRNAKLAIARDLVLDVYDGLSPSPERTLPIESASCLALFAQYPDDEIMIAAGNYSGLTIRRYSDNQIVGVNDLWSAPGPCSASDIDGDRRVELIGPNLSIWRVNNDFVFTDGFDRHFP